MNQISIDPHAPFIKNVICADDLPNNTDAIIDQSVNGINYAKRIGSTVYVQTHRRLSYDKTPRVMTAESFNRWRNDILRSAQNDKFSAPSVS